MLDALAPAAETPEARRARVRRFVRARRAGRWLLLTGWIVLPLMPALAFALSRMLGLEF